MIPGMLGRYAFWKRAADLGAAAVLIAISAPLLVLSALAILCSSPGPVLHRRKVLGKRAFHAYKLRTMRVDADERMAHDPELRERWRQAAKLDNDPRITPVGAFLRRWGIDELPQLWNVVAGDMSLVGPRFRTAEEWSVCAVARDRILSVEPGITGLWQVSGHHRVSPEERLKLDLEYVARRSFWCDLQILLRTPKALWTLEAGK